MLTTSARLLHLIGLLQSRRFWTGRALAQELGVTERSVRRDVDRVRELGYPVHATSGVGGGYSLGAGTDLPPLPLDDEEAVAVAVGLRAAVSGPFAGLEQAGLRALTKLEQVLPQRLRARVGAIQAVTTGLSDGSPALDALVLASLANACQDGVLLRFAYRDRTGASTERRVEPYRLVHTGRVWYLVAFDRDRDDWRTFRVDRLTSPVASHRFQPRALPSDDLASWVGERVALAPRRHRVRLRVHAPAEVVRARFASIHAKVQPDGPQACVLETTGDDLPHMAWWFSGIEHDFEVIEPAALAAVLRSMGERLLRASHSSPQTP